MRKVQRSFVAWAICYTSTARTLMGIAGLGRMQRLRRARGWVLYYTAAMVLAVGIGGRPTEAQCYINGEAYGCSWVLSPCPYSCNRFEYVTQFFSPDCDTDTCMQGTCWIFDWDYSGMGCVMPCYIAQWTRCKFTWDA